MLSIYLTTYVFLLGGARGFELRAFGLESPWLQSAASDWTARISLSLSLPISICIYMYMYVYMCMYMYVYMYMYMYIHTYIHTYIHIIYIYIYTHVYIYIYIYNTLPKNTQSAEGRGADPASNVEN